MFYRLIRISPFIFILFFGAVFVDAQSAKNLSDKLKGRILIQVQRHGEAWYVKPDDGARVFMGRPSDAFALMRSFSLGITNADIRKIPIGKVTSEITNFPSIDDPRFKETTDKNMTATLDCARLLPKQGTEYTDCVLKIMGDTLGFDMLQDSDGDGYTDVVEIANNYDPFGDGKLPIDPVFTKKLHGTILLEVEKRGEAWYVDPLSSRRYFLGRPSDALNIMRGFGLGITDADLETIPLSSSAKSAAVTTKKD